EEHLLLCADPPDAGLDRPLLDHRLEGAQIHEEALHEEPVLVPPQLGLDFLDPHDRSEIRRAACDTFRPRSCGPPYAYSSVTRARPADPCAATRGRVAGGF